MANVNLPQNWADMTQKAPEQAPAEALACPPTIPTKPADRYAHVPSATRDGINSVNYELGLLTNVVALIAENFANTVEGDFVHQQMYGALWHIKHQLEAAQSTLEDIGRGRSVEAKP